MTTETPCSTGHPASLTGKWSRRSATALFVVAGLGCGGADAPTPPTTVPALPADAGIVQVTTVTSGVDLDTDGYVVQTDGYWDYTLEPTPVPTNGIVSLRGIPAGEHTLTLLNVAPNCSGENLDTRPIVVTSKAATRVVFQLACERR